MPSYRNNSLFPVSIAQTLVNLVSSARYVVGGNSMLPHLANQQYLLVARCQFSWNRLERGDIVAFRHPIPIMRDHIYIKRIIGLPDEDIRLEGSNVYIGGRLLEETYLSTGTVPTRQDTPTPQLRGYDREWWLGPAEYFVISDNRNEGRDDSRAFGPINRQLIIGRAWFRYWPPGSWGPIRSR